MMPGDWARFSTLHKTIPMISERMLSLTLRGLERDGLLSRHVFAEVSPRVEYQLTTMGRTLLPALQGLVDWVAGNADGVKAARIAFDR
jgi:DNA-binding HxlR family transcriptional regulator